MINVLQGIALSVVGLAIVSTMGLVLLSQLQMSSSMTATANTTVNTLITAISSLASWVGIIITLMICIYFIRVFSGGGAQTGGRVM
jgi:hypothetical protein